MAATAPSFGSSFQAAGRGKGEGGTVSTFPGPFRNLNSPLLLTVHLAEPGLREARRCSLDRGDHASRNQGWTLGPQEISTILAQRKLFPVPLCQVSSLQGGCPVCGRVTAAHFCSLTPKQTIFAEKQLIPFPLKQRSLNPLEANTLMFKLTPEACCPGSRHTQAFPTGPSPMISSDPGPVPRHDQRPKGCSGMPLPWDPLGQLWGPIHNPSADLGS